jgi:hypothetical protein
LSSIIERCENCKYSMYKSMNDSLICRRYPPSSIANIYANIKSVYPEVKADDVCGEYKEREES